VKRAYDASDRFEALAHFLAGLEEGTYFWSTETKRAGARIAPGAGRAVLHREGAEAAQLDRSPRAMAAMISPRIASRYSRTSR